MPLLRARSYAIHLVRWLRPHCLRLCIAGSIRRRRKTCGDVDLVAIPKTSEQTDLLGPTGEPLNHAWVFLSVFCANPANQARLLSGGRPDSKSMSILLRKCQLDIWFATPMTWSSLLLSKTGSTAHNVWLAMRAQDRGLHWQPSVGLQRRCDDHIDLLDAPTERDLYACLGLKWLPPRYRELDWLKSNIDGGLS